MFYQIILSPQVKRCAIINYEHGTSELPHEFPNDLRLRKLGKIRKVPKLNRMIPWCPVPPPKFCQYQRKTLEKHKLNFSRSALFFMKTRVSLKYFVNDCR